MVQGCSAVQGCRAEQGGVGEAGRCRVVQAKQGSAGGADLRVDGGGEGRVFSGHRGAVPHVGRDVQRVVRTQHDLSGPQPRHDAARTAQRGVEVAESAGSQRAHVYLALPG